MSSLRLRDGQHDSRSKPNTGADTNSFRQFRGLLLPAAEPGRHVLGHFVGLDSRFRRRPSSCPRSDQLLPFSNTVPWKSTARTWSNGRTPLDDRAAWLDSEAIYSATTETVAPPRRARTWCSTAAPTRLTTRRLRNAPGELHDRGRTHHHGRRLRPPASQPRRSERDPALDPLDPGADDHGSYGPSSSSYLSNQTFNYTIKARTSKLDEFRRDGLAYFNHASTLRHGAVLRRLGRGH